jgi:trimethylamine--corrinoid protein Co-methyltransferase
MNVFKVLSENQLQKIHQATLQVLSETGAIILEASCLKRLADEGAKVDFDQQKAYFPPELVESCLQKTPKGFTWYGRDPEKNIQMKGDHVHFGPVGGSIYVIDTDGKRRPSSIQDAQNFVRIIDALEHLHEGHCMVHPMDVPDKVHHVHMMLAMARNTVKPFRGRLAGKKQAQDCIHMAKILAGGSKQLKEKPNLACHVNTISPLCHGTDMTEGLVVYACAGLPVIISPEVMAGATGPVSLAGTLVVQNAEVLSGLVLAQLFNPGTPVVYGTVSTIIDFASGNIAYGAIEQSMLNAASAQLAKFYDLPCRGTAGVTDSNTIDVQAGIESATSNLCQALAGINFIHAAAGGLEGTVTASYQKLIIDDEIIGRALRFVKGIAVSEKTLALNVIDEVGPQGNFLSHGHTLDLFREEHFLPRLSQCKKYDIWTQQGKPTMLQQASDRVNELLSTHRPDPLDETLDAELVTFVKAVEKRELQ